ncbi:MAG TPA: hypothetical protein VFA33_06360 [Bryobacteraceae bacterium]|nr:hypothetical protein [Bryobacteraceae bacterium]
MPGKSHAYSDAVLNVLNGDDLPGVTPYVALFSVAPGDDGSAGTELTASGYARQATTFGAPGAGDSANQRKIANTNNLQFGPASADWLQAVAFGIFDALTNGNLLYWNTLTTPKTVQQGDFGQFAPGSLAVEED